MEWEKEGTSSIMAAGSGLRPSGVPGSLWSTPPPGHGDGGGYVDDGS